MSLFSFFRAIAKPIAHSLYKLTYEGADNVPLEGGVILASNHQHAIDPGLIAVGIKRPFSAMAKNELFDKRLVSPLLKKLGAFPVKRDISDISAIRYAVSLLEKGKCLMIFPEGTRCPDKPLERIKSGAAAISFMADCPIVPIAVIAPEGTKLRKPITIRFGKPIMPSELNMTRISTKQLRGANELLLGRMRELHDNVQD